MNIFVRMLRDVYGIDSTINEAPPRIALNMFGGPFDIKSFREQTNVCITITPPFVSYCMLIEERQPLQNVGEQTELVQRGTVRGLRRPSEQPSSSKDIEDISQPQVEGLYASFLSERKEEKSATNSGDAPPAKRPRTRTVKPQSGGGLAKFAATKV